ncbi:diguanylate cyclase [Acetivibrio thermocellus]|uniref:diguanylate cyclase n=1 Tax=Acetivibrio thermocellus TaxID=1515 RepID=UPI0010A63234|nr:diguanylate cyclase [Acetivibrio thermocellus]THJ78278.1 diguanylate cyclase [Acetivibrio thermocellus]
MCKEDKNKEIIRIVLNKRYDIQYASIDNQNAIECLEKQEVLHRLSDDLPVEYNLKDYHVTIDEVNITGNMYYVITAVLRHPKCENCRKALTDAVTGLYNRNYWEQIISGATFQPRTQNFSLILIDVDNLKEINDTYGHMAGDKAIEIVGQAIKNSIRKEDAGLRYGGDEFIILLFNQDKKAAYRVIERIRREISELAAGQGINIQISAGAAYYDCLRNMGDIIKMADRDLYKEKRVKKSKEKQNSEKLKHLLREIEKLRDELNKKVTLEGKGINNEETLKLSQKLDELITRYLIDE